MWDESGVGRKAESLPVPICALNRSCSLVTSADRMSMPKRTTCNAKKHSVRGAVG